MLFSTEIKIDRHPGFERFGRCKCLVIMRIKIAIIIPARTHKRIQRIDFPLPAIAVLFFDAFLECCRIRQRRLSCRFEVDIVRQCDRQVRFRHRQEARDDGFVENKLLLGKTKMRRGRMCIDNSKFRKLIPKTFRIRFVDIFIPIINQENKLIGKRINCFPVVFPVKISRCVVALLFNIAINQNRFCNLLSTLLEPFHRNGSAKTMRDNNRVFG